MKSKMRKRLESLFKTHTISKNIELIMLMLENKASLEEIGMMLGVHDLSFKDLIESLNFPSKEFNYEYIHLKMFLEHRLMLKGIYKHMLTKFSYSFVLISASIFMNCFYLIKFNPMIKNMMQDFGIKTNTVSLQNSISYSILIVSVITAIVFLVLYLFYRVFPEIFKLIALKHNAYLKMVITRLTLSQYKIAFGYFSSHSETIKAIKYVHSTRLIDLMATHIDANISDNNLVFQSNDSWMIDPYLSMATLGLETIEIDALIDSYLKLSEKKDKILLSNYANLVKIIAIVLVGIIIYVFYTSLMMPLGIMEVL